MEYFGNENLWSLYPRPWHYPCHLCPISRLHSVCPKSIFKSFTLPCTGAILRSSWEWVRPILSICVFTPGIAFSIAPVRCRPDLYFSICTTTPTTDWVLVSPLNNVETFSVTLTIPKVYPADPYDPYRMAILVRINGGVFSSSMRTGNSELWVDWSISTISALSFANLDQSWFEPRFEAVAGFQKVKFRAFADQKGSNSCEMGWNDWEK